MISGAAGEKRMKIWKTTTKKGKRGKRGENEKKEKKVGGKLERKKNLKKVSEF